MAKAKISTTNVKRGRPALTDDARSNQMISLATDLAEQQLRDGTASSQVIVHYLKLGTEKAKLENQLLQANAEMARAKKEVLQSQKRSEELFADAIKAFRNYSGQGEDDGDY